MFKKIYKDMTAGQMINQIHMECDTSAGLRQLSDEKLIEVYKSVFKDHPIFG